MSFNEKPKESAPPSKGEGESKPDINECIKQKVTEGMTEEEARGYCEKQTEGESSEKEVKVEEKQEVNEDGQKTFQKEKTVEEEKESPSGEPVREITEEDPNAPQDPNAPPKNPNLANPNVVNPNDPNAPVQDPNAVPNPAAPGGGQGFGQYANFEQCLQEQLGQGLNSKDSVVNCAAQLLQNMQAQGQATAMPPQGAAPYAASYEVAGVTFNVAEFPKFEDCVVAYKGKGMGKEEAISKCNSIFNAKFDKIPTAADYVQVQTAKDSDKLYLRAFLLDSSVNKNLWGVNSASIDERIGTFIGRPLVLTEDFGHPELKDMNFGHALLHQDIYRIGTIVDVVQTAKSEIDKGKKIWYAIIELTDAKAKEAFKNHKLPLYVSPAVAKMNVAEEDGKIEEWLGMHLALVDKPAFGVEKAQITGSCSGEEDKCVLHLRQAKIEKDGYGSCGFCVYGKLMSVLKASEDKPQKLEVDPKTNKIVADSEVDNKKASETSNSSLTSEKGQEQLTMSKTENIDTKVAEAKEEIQKAELEKQKIAESNNDYKGFNIVEAKLARYEVENKLLKEKIEDITGKYDTLNAQYQTLQSENRKAEIRSIVTAQLYPDPKQREKMIDYFVDKNIPSDMVAEIYASMDTIPNVKGAKYDSKVPLIKTASTNKDIEATSLAKEARKMFIKGGSA